MAVSATLTKAPSCEYAYALGIYLLLSELKFSTDPVWVKPGISNDYSESELYVKGTLLRIKEIKNQRAWPRND